MKALSHPLRGLAPWRVTLLYLHATKMKNCLNSFFLFVCLFFVPIGVCHRDWLEPLSLAHSLLGTLFVYGPLPFLGKLSYQLDFKRGSSMAN